MDVQWFFIRLFALTEISPFSSTTVTPSEAMVRNWYLLLISGLSRPPSQSVTFVPYQSSQLLASTNLSHPERWCNVFTTVLEDRMCSEGMIMLEELIPLISHLMHLFTLNFLFLPWRGRLHQLGNPKQSSPPILWFRKIDTFASALNDSLSQKPR